MKLLLAIVTMLCSSAAMAAMWESKNYKDYTIVADKSEIVFRFTGEGDHSVCASGVELVEELVLLQDGARHREYILKVAMRETGVSKQCYDGAIVAMAIVKPVASKWYRLPKDHSTTIILPSSMSIEIK